MLEHQIIIQRIDKILSPLFCLVLLFKILQTNISSKRLYRDFPGGVVVNNPPASAGDTGSSPGPGRSHMPQSN